MSPVTSRQLAFGALKNVYRGKAYTDIALNRVLQSTEINSQERDLTCELVYGVVRRRRTLDGLIDSLGKKKARQQPPDLRIVLHLGLYQLRYLDRIPPSAAVNTSVELSKQNGMGRLAGVVNGLLRSYIRSKADPLKLPTDKITAWGISHSFPDWIVNSWLEQIPESEIDQIATWFNKSPHLDLRVNILQTTVAKVIDAFKEVNISLSPIPYLPQGLRLNDSAGAVASLPGYNLGWWSVQDSSAQLVSHLLDPQPGETIIDACAAPGGKTTHIAELMGDRGKIIACDRYQKRLGKVTVNTKRLKLRSITINCGDSRNLKEFHNFADRVLLDAPCSGLGTLHKRPDIRWRQTPKEIMGIVSLQKELLQQAEKWVKPQGILVYATCTLNLLENEKVIQSFLASYSNWKVEFPNGIFRESRLVTSAGWIKVYPHHHNMDGFFMVKLRKNS